MFFVGRFQEFIAELGIPGYQGLSPVKRLRRYLTGMIHPHESGREFALGLVQTGGLFIARGRRAGGPWPTADDAHRTVQFGQQAIGKCARVTLVGIGSDILLFSLGIQHGAPLDPGWKGGPA